MAKMISERPSMLRYTYIVRFLFSLGIMVSRRLISFARWLDLFLKAVSYFAWGIPKRITKFLFGISNWRREIRTWYHLTSHRYLSENMYQPFKVTSHLQSCVFRMTSLLNTGFCCYITKRQGPCCGRPVEWQLRGKKHLTCPWWYHTEML